MGGKNGYPRVFWQSAAVLGLLALFAAALIVALGHASPDLSGGRTVLAIFAAQVPLLAGCMFTGWRFAGLAGPPATFMGGFLASSVAQIAALVAPARLWEAVRPAVLNLHDKVPFGRGIGAAAIERVLDVAMLGAMASFALATTSTKFSHELRVGVTVLSALLATGVVAVACLVFLPRFAQAMVERLPFAPLRAFANEGISAVRLLGSPVVALRALLASVLVWLMAYLTFQIIFIVIADGRLDWHEVLVVFVISTIGLAASVAPAGLGTFEGSVVASLVSFGYPLADATAIAIALRLALSASAFPPMLLATAFSGLRPAAIFESLTGRSRQ